MITQLAAPPTNRLDNPFGFTPADVVPPPPPMVLPRQRACPFCDCQTGNRHCDGCGRDVTLPRRVCGHCRQATPTNDRVCCRCGHRASGELAWKIPVILLLFFLVFVLNVLIALS